VAAVRELLREYLTWTLTLDENALRAPTFAGVYAELASLPGIFSPPDGRLLLARSDDVAAGCVALRPHHTTTGELKRLYVRPAFRGARIGQQLVERLVGEAREIGYRRLVLDSHVSMRSAHAIYESVGFRVVPTPDTFPEVLKPVVVFMECEL